VRKDGIKRTKNENEGGHNQYQTRLTVSPVCEGPLFSNRKENKIKHTGEVRYKKMESTESEKIGPYQMGGKGEVKKKTKTLKERGPPSK